MSENLADRLQLVLQMGGLKTPGALDVKAGLQAGRTQRLLGGDLGDNVADALAQIAVATSTSVEWLVSGIGPPRRVPITLPSVCQRELPGWDAAVGAAQAVDPAIPLEVWAIAGEVVGIEPRDGVSSSYALDLALFVHRWASDDRRARARVLLEGANDAPPAPSASFDAATPARPVRRGTREGDADEKAAVAVARRALRPTRPDLDAALTALLRRSVRATPRGGVDLECVEFLDDAEPRAVNAPVSWYALHSASPDAITEAGAASRELIARGLLPASWAEEVAAGQRNAPWSVETLVALAAARDTIVEVERLARAVLARLANGGPNAPLPVEWRSKGRGSWTPPLDERWIGEVRQRLYNSGITRAWAPAQRARGVALSAGLSAEGAERLAADIACRRAWARSCPRLLNPFEPLLQIWELGYVLDSVSETSIVLVVPEV